MRVLLAALLLAQFASPAVARTAQKPEPVLEPGARVRVTLLARKDEPVVGTLLSLPAGSIEIEDSTARSIPLADVKKLELSRGIKTRAGRYAQYGALVFTPLGAWAGAEAAHDLGGDEVATGVVCGILGALVGAGFGAIVGQAFEEEHWQEVRVE
jgi:hypothetical protein